MLASFTRRVTPQLLRQGALSSQNSSLNASRPTACSRWTAHTIKRSFIDAPGPELDSQWRSLSEVKLRGQNAPSAPTKSQAPEVRWQQNSETDLAKLALPQDAYAGRSVEVRNGNVGEALAQLQTILQRNRVQAEIRATSRHEKKGEKRRRLRSQRWRRRFAHEVRKKVQLVNEIRARGA